MNTTQEQVTEMLNTSPTPLFITGGAGTGKSFVVNRWLETVDRADVAICAPTGVAALNVGGVTLHRMFHIPFSIADVKYQAVVSARQMKPEKRSYLNNISTLMIDEISMVRSDILSFVDEVLKEVRQSDEPFGGVRLIAVGDPFQLPPVVPKHEKEKLPKPWFFQTKIWHESGTLTMNLTKVYRQADDDTFANCLNAIRKGKQAYTDLNTINARRDVANDDAMILGTTNRKVNERNDNELEKIDEDEYHFEMDVENLVTDYDIAKNVMAPLNLYLKVGARVMMLVNQRGYVNGSLGYVVDICLSSNDPKEDFIRVRLDNGLTVAVERYKWVSEECSMDEGDLLTRTLGIAIQFPMKLGYAITVHKSQGMTFPNMHFELDFVFERGQTYVALSRAVSLEGLTLGNKLRDSHIMCDKAVKAFMADI